MLSGRVYVGVGGCGMIGRAMVGGGIYRDESLCSLITFMFVCQYLFFFDKKGRLPIKKMNPKNTRLSKKTPITHKEFNQKIPTF